MKNLKNKIMKNIHVLPTEKFSNLILQTTGELRISELELRGQVGNGFTQNIYITSDEEIKYGDWTLMFDDLGNLFLCDKPQQYLGIEKGHHLNKGLKKIILTDNEDLIKDGVQAIEDEFLEWFVKNPSCEKVDIMTDAFTVKEMSMLPIGTRNLKYKIIIPKEKPKQEFPQFGTKEFNDLASAYFGGNPKQETLENLKNQLKKVIKEHPIDVNEDTYWRGVKIGLETAIEVVKLKEQDKKMYSEEDLKEAFLDGWQLRDGDLPFPKAKKKWFEQFKNK